MIDAWGGSWGASWGVSWGAGHPPPPQPGSLAYGRSPKQRREEKKPSAARITQFAREITEQLEAVAISEAKAEEIARRIERLETLISESELSHQYLLIVVSNLAAAVRKAAAFNEAEKRRRQLVEAAQIAARLEADLRDEEDAIILLLA